MIAEPTEWLDWPFQLPEPTEGQRIRRQLHDDVTGITWTQDCVVGRIERDPISLRVLLVVRSSAVLVREPIAPAAP